MQKKVWVNIHGGLYLVDKQKELPSTIEPCVYELQHSLMGFYLKPISEKFEFPYKIYGLEEGIIKRVMKYYNNTESGNLGVLFNGTKGTGKTVTSKILCNYLKQPVIIVSTPFEGAENFINTIQQDVTIFIDEYEKNYQDSHQFLTIMDGVLNSTYRRVFLLTTNNLHIDRNLIDRPSRIRYLKTFENLSPEVVEEIVDDILEDTRYKEDCIKFISTLEIITVDIVKTIINEVNIQEESPLNFRGVFNASTKKGKYKIFMDGIGEDIDAIEIKPFVKGVSCSPRPDYGDHTIGGGFYINDTYIGEIKEVVDYNTIKVKINEFDSISDNEEPTNEIAQKKVSVKFQSLDAKKKEQPKKTKGNSAVIKDTPMKIPAGIRTFVVREDYYFNESYRYGPRDFSGSNYEDF